MDEQKAAPTVAEIFDSMEYGPAPEEAGYVRDWLAKRSPFGLYIGGKWSDAQSGKSFESRDPATGDVLARIAHAGAADVDMAVAAARKAFPKWSKLPGHERAKVMYAIARLVQKNSRFLAVLETLDNGKPIRESRDIDIPLVARHFYHHAGWAQLADSELADFEPHGVVGQVIPWNFPLLMMAWKIAPAIAAGNTVVLKPAEFTSLSALYFCDLLTAAGVPEGVVNIITGEGETGAALVGHQDINKVAFTGSTEVGRIIRKQIAGSGKALTLELGGKSPFIVFEDADLDSAVEGLVDAIWFNQGQVCCAGSRLLMEESIAERLIAKVKHRLESFRVGDPLDKAVDMGPVVDPSQHKTISTIVDQAVAEGAERWQPSTPCPDTGCFFPPTLLTGVSPANVAAREEIFGPVLAAMSFRTMDEAVALANNTRYGLAASVWSENINRALAVAGALKAGVVWVNSTNQFDAAVGFGGYRESGFGREGGMEGMMAYLKPRTDFLSKGSDLIEDPDDASAPPVLANIDRTPKMYIGGKQKRPDGGNSRPVIGAKGKLIGQVGDGNRKDIRDAVEAAVKADAWSSATHHNRAQVVYYLAENLSIRADEFAKRLADLTGASPKQAEKEVDAAIARLFSYGAWADKFDGAVHTPPVRNVVLAVHEPLGVVGIACPDSLPLLSFVSLLAPNLAMGNRTIIIPSQRYPLLATDFYQLLDTSDVPAGVVNIVTGDRDGLVKTLADHAGVDGLWYFGSADGVKAVEFRAADNMKRVWSSGGRARDWHDAKTGEGRQFLREAVQVKNIWLPYGD